MTEEQVLVGIAMVSAASIICVLSAKVIDHKAKIKELEIQAETMTSFQKTVAQAQIETIKATTELISISDVNDWDFEFLTKEEQRSLCFNKKELEVKND